MGLSQLYKNYLPHKYLCGGRALQRSVIRLNLGILLLINFITLSNKIDKMNNNKKKKKTLFSNLNVLVATEIDKFYFYLRAFQNVDLIFGPYQEQRRNKGGNQYVFILLLIIV